MRRTFTVSREVALGPDEERRRVLRDLHDSVGPTLAAAALGVHSARNLLHQDRAAAERVLVRIEEELHSAIAEIRRLAREVRSPVLARLGLVDAIRLYSETLNSRVPAEGQGGGRLRIEVDVSDGLPALPAAVELAAYRIVCEALTNVARHSHAQLPSTASVIMVCNDVVPQRDAPGKSGHRAARWAALMGGDRRPYGPCPGFWRVCRCFGMLGEEHPPSLGAGDARAQSRS